MTRSRPLSSCPGALLYLHITRVLRRTLHYTYSSQPSSQTLRTADENAPNPPTPPLPLPPPPLPSLLPLSTPTHPLNRPPPPRTHSATRTATRAGTWETHSSSLRLSSESPRSASSPAVDWSSGCPPPPTPPRRKCAGRWKS